VTIEGEAVLIDREDRVKGAAIFRFFAPFFFEKNEKEKDFFFFFEKFK
jgi:hypothetical protein